MNCITAIVKPHQLNPVMESLKSAGVAGITVTEVSGFGRQGGHTETYRGAEYVIESVPKMKLEVLCTDDQVESLIEAIAGVANTGTVGDGKIWTTALGTVVRIRTGERGPDAI